MDSSVREIKGVPASPGKARGLVRLDLGPEDFYRVKEGDILVAEMTRPDFVLVMKKAGAIVTDEGSLTSHAAVVSRELGIPCIVGARSATQVLKNRPVPI